MQLAVQQQPVEHLLRLGQHPAFRQRQAVQFHLISHLGHFRCLLN
jgi:hypothetical protein